MDTIDRRLINRIQRNFPVCSRPFKVLAEELGIPEAEIISRLERLKSAKIIRRLGAVFDSQKLGFSSTLIAMRVPEERLDKVAGIVNQYRGVTHNYQRPAKYNMWFTVTAESPARLDEIIGEIKTKTGITDLLNLPALRLFKINVDFQLEE